MSMTPPLLPDLGNPVLAPFWAAAREGQFVIRHCCACGQAQWPPRPTCAGCRGIEFKWRPADSRGTVYSYFVAHKPLHPAFEAEVPYAAGSVTLPNGLRMLGRIVGVDPDEVRIGMPVRPRFVRRATDVTLIYWEPDPTERGA
jgi:uncharacterized OB-fold protein